MGMKGNGGEIVQVQGGHIVRPTGKKDRHSKVYTSKGPRDRRVRLSAHTAIQFYDVQDRLGYDRPSKAVDWLIKKAKTAIEQLAELPPWHPTTNATNANLETHQDQGSDEMGVPGPGQMETPGYGFQLQRQLFIENPNNNSPFITGHMDSDCVPDTMKSFFPTSSAALSLNFQNYPADIISRATNHTEDLGLSLHSFQNQTLVHGQSQENTSHTPLNHHQELFGSDPVGFEANYQRNVAWGNDLTTFPQQHQPIALVGNGPDFSQRGTLQSSFAQYVRAWSDLPMASLGRQRTQELHQSFILGSRFASEGFPGFNIPAGIQGEEEQSIVSDRPSTSSPNSQQ